MGHRIKPTIDVLELTVLKDTMGIIIIQDNKDVNDIIQDIKGITVTTNSMDVDASETL
jgi:hypothetical protein